MDRVGTRQSHSGFPGLAAHEPAHRDFLKSTVISGDEVLSPGQQRHHGTACA
jgi:hypothetical protein